MASWLRYYNKDLIGMSVGSHYAEVIELLYNQEQYTVNTDMISD